MTKAVALKSTNTEVAELHSQAVAQAKAMEGAGIGMEDLEIPKIMLMQSTSNAVGEEEAEFGQIVNTMDGSVLGGIEEGPVEIVPLKQFKTVRIYDVSEQPPKFLRVEPDNGKNSSFEQREGREGDMPVKRVLNMNFFVLLKKELEADEAFPLIVSFKSTGIPAGKQLATQMFKMLQLGKLPYSKTVKLVAKKDKKDKNTFAVFGIEKGEAVSEAHQAIAAKWLVSLAAAKVTIHNDEESDAEETSTSSAAPTVVGSEAGSY
jgi:hypothetical protein